MDIILDNKNIKLPNIYETVIYKIKTQNTIYQ